ncbi:hypothetical protein BpHYR1_014600, partial [Brachionus plicatilis]
YLNAAEINKYDPGFEQTEHFQENLLDTNNLESTLEQIPLQSHINKNTIEYLNAAEINKYDPGFEQTENFQENLLDTNNLESTLDQIPLQTPLQRLKTIQAFNAPKDVQSEDIAEHTHSFVEEMNLENISFDFVQNEVTQRHSKFSVHYLNAAKIISESYSSLHEAHSFSIESRSESNLELKEQSEYLNREQKKTRIELLNAPIIVKKSFENLEEAQVLESDRDLVNKIEPKIEQTNLSQEQLESKIKFLNAPNTEEDTLSDFEEAESFRLDPDSQVILNPSVQANNLSFSQTKNQVETLNAPQTEHEELSSEKLDFFGPDEKNEAQLEPKIEIELVNLKPYSQVNQALNAPKLNEVSLSHIDDADSLDGSEPLVEEPFISQYNISLTKASSNERIIFLNAPKHQVFNFDTDEKAENFHIQSNNGQSSIIRIQSEANLNASRDIIRPLAAPKIGQVDQNLENVENFDIEILNESRLEINDWEPGFDNASRKSVIILGAGVCRNLSHTSIEKADSFESRKEMENTVIRNEANYQNYANVQEPVRVLMCEMESSIPYAFNEDANELQNEKFVESVEFKHESNTLNNKPDKKFLLWLNYPKLVQNEEEEAKRIDETFDYLYERVVADIKSNESCSLEKDSNMVHIEKVLSLFISNQEHVEYNEEILRFFPNHRPEVQHLMLNQTKPVEFEKAKRETLEQQVEPKDLSLEEDSIEEMIKQKNGSDSSSEETRPSSRVIFSKSDLSHFFNQDENLNQFSNFIQPSQINKITNQIILNAAKNTSLEQKLEETWQLNLERKYEQTSESDLATIPIIKSSNWNDLMTSSQNDENTLSIHTDEGSFFENYETVETIENKVHSTLIDENFDLSDDVSIHIRQKSDSENDTDSTSLSESSGRMHLIECVEVLTGPGVQDSLQIKKVDFNRLRVKEKSKFQTDDPKSRFKINLKKEEIVDLSHQDNLNVTTKQEFAKKFVEQIINLNASRLSPHLALTDHTERLNRDINCIASKNTNEILNTLSSIKCDLSKHFADSLISEYGPESNLMGEQCLNMNLMEDFSDKEDLFENFSNRLHSSSNFGDALRNDYTKESTFFLTIKRTPLQLRICMDLSSLDDVVDQTLD